MGDIDAEIEIYGLFKYSQLLFRGTTHSETLINGGSVLVGGN